jgi:hypothetical protein
MMIECLRGALPVGNIVFLEVSIKEALTGSLILS